MLCRIRHNDSPSLITDHWLLTTALRRDLKNQTNLIRAAVSSGGVEIAAAVEDYVASRGFADAAPSARQCPAAVGRCESKNLRHIVEIRAVEAAGSIHGQLPDDALI